MGVSIFNLIVVIIALVSVMIVINNMKYKLNNLEKKVNHLSSLLEENLNDNKEAPQEQVSESTIVSESKDLEPSLKELKRVSTVKAEPVISKIKTKIKPKSNLFTIESIISKLGIFLLLIGVGFIYKLAYDKGYITPTLVVFLGYIFGLIVVGLGVRVRKKNREVLSQVLFGGGIAILYITTFAAYQGYGLMGSFLAFVFLFAITFLAFFIALSINSMAMSIVALLGGLLTPFIVGLDVLGLYGTGLYILFIAIGSMAVYVFKRWRTLQITAIVGISFITVLLASSGGFTQKETIEFSLLLLALFMVFYGVEYVHYYIGRDYKKELFLTAAIVSILPVFTLIQTLMVLDLSKESWALVFAIVSLGFFVLNYLLFKKRKHSLITDILMGYVGMFTLIGIILYFGGEVRYIAILILSLIFIVIYSKSRYLLTRIIGLVIYMVGYSWALYDLVNQIFDEELELILLGVRLVVMILISFIAFMQKDFIRKILGGFAFQLYLFGAILSMMLILTEDKIDEIVITLIVFGVMIGLFVWLNKKFKLLSIHSIIVMSILPFMLKLITSSIVTFDQEILWIQVLFFVIYGLGMYSLTLTVLKKDAKTLIFILKCIAYGILSSIVLVEISVWSQHFGYGLILFVGIVFVIDYFENKNEGLMIALRHVFRIGFMLMFVVYTFSVLGFSDFNFIHFLIDLVLVAAFYYFLKDYIKDSRAIYVLISLLYMIVIYQNLQIADNGSVTLFWAAYGIISLAYFLFKGRRHLVYFALGLIVLVAIKFIVVDLSTIEMIWKIVTSMAFGAGLLVLSYVIQPLLDKYGSEEIEQIKENK